MPRVKRGVTARARHKKVLDQAKGFRGRRGNVYRIAKEEVMKAGQYAYRDRRQKKREFRALWIARINAAVREMGMTYSTGFPSLPSSTDASDTIGVVAMSVKHADHLVAQPVAAATGTMRQVLIGPDEGPSVVEFICRFGDPETQAVLPIADTDLLGHLWAIGAREAWRPAAQVAARGAAVTTVLAAAGYPDQPVKGAPIAIPEPGDDDAVLFHAGTTRDAAGSLQVAGGRVLCATGFGPDVARAAAVSRNLAERIAFAGRQFRRDIAWREVRRAGAA